MPMDLSQLFILATLFFLVGMLIWGRYPVGVIFSSVAFVYFVAGFIPIESLTRQIVNPGLITVVLLMLLATVLNKVRLLEVWANRLVRGNYRSALAKLLAVVGLQSAFLNNTAVVASLIGPLRAASKKDAPRLLLPMSYAATLGGMLTLIGTSTNLLLSGFISEAGLPEWNIFTPLPMGILLFCICLGIMLLLYPYLLKSSEVEETPREDYLIDARVSEDCPLIGQTVSQAGLIRLDELRLVEIVRHGQVIAPVRAYQTVRPGDILVFAGDVSRLDLLSQFPGLVTRGHGQDIPTDNLLEVMVSGESALAGQRLGRVDFRLRYDASIVAVRPVTPHFDLMKGQLPMRLQAGDTLVLATGPDFTARNSTERNFIPISRPMVTKFVRPWKSHFALSSFLLTILGASLGLFSLIKGLVCLLVLSLALNLVRAQELRRNVPWQLIFTIASALVISYVLSDSGLAAIFANGVLSALGNDPRLSMIAILLLTALMTEMMTNNAAAALMFPVALSTATTLGLDYMPFVMAVLYGASASFLTPHGYQTNLMVMSPGGYRPVDYLRAGLPISVTYLGSAAFLLPVFFPF